jgi:hypothetical protein
VRGPLEHLVAAAVADVVLVHVQLAVEAEVVRIRAQKALDVGRPGKLVERLVLERPQVFRADLGALLEPGKSSSSGHAPRAGCYQSRTRRLILSRQPAERVTAPRIRLQELR